MWTLLITAVTTVEFTTEQGNLPPLTADTSALLHSGVAPTVLIAELQKGTKANVECSNRGICGTFGHTEKEPLDESVLFNWTLNLVLLQWTNITSLCVCFLLICC